MWTPVQGDDTHLMDLFGQNRHVTRKLEQSHIVVITTRHHRRSGPLLVNTTLAQGAILYPLCGACYDCTAIAHTLLSFRRQGWELPIWWIHN